VGALKFIQIPYNDVETYTAYEPYTVMETYNETILTEVKIPTTYNKTVMVKEPIPTTASLLDPHPIFLSKEKCFLEPYNYTITYEGDLSELALYRAFAPYRGFRASNTQSAYAYDKSEEIGYKDGVLYQKAIICNAEPRMMVGKFKRCHYQGDEKGECPNTEIVRVTSRSMIHFENPCTEVRLWWRTSYDVDKNIRLEPELVSQKITCYDGTREKPRARYYDLNYISDVMKEEVFGYKGAVLDPIRIKGRVVGFRNKPLVSSISESKVTYRERTDFEEVTEYQVVMRNVTVEKTREVTKYKEVGDMRDAVLYRSLWKAIVS